MKQTTQQLLKWLEDERVRLRERVANSRAAVKAAQRTLADD